MTKNKKITWIIGGILLIVIAVVAVMVSLQWMSASANRKGEETRTKLKSDFIANLSLYDQAFELSCGDRYIGREYCLILTDGDPTAKIAYESVSVGSEELDEQVRNFATRTGTDVIYASTDAVYYKFFFESGLNQKSEANFIHFFDESTSVPEGCTPLQNGWYYKETVIE